MTDAPKCPRCGENHALVACPNVKAVQFDPSGAVVVRAEFVTEIDCWPPSRGDKPEESGPDYPKKKGTP